MHTNQSFFVRVLTIDFWKIEKNAVSVMKTINTFYTKICLFLASNKIGRILLNITLSL